MAEEVKEVLIVRVGQSHNFTQEVKNRFELTLKERLSKYCVVILFLEDDIKGWLSFEVLGRTTIREDMYLLFKKIICKFKKPNK